MINRNDFEFANEPFPYKLYIQELETELVVQKIPSMKPRDPFNSSERTIILFKSILSPFRISLRKMESHFQNFTDKPWIRQ
ncbi:hypothetical protein [Roseburia sp. AM59-24XD]|uniref:hypothetical protein n=1 Tax=Roseburia sp. AM59-24XD TaxID=2293138 RepID=UPI000E520715|nr:hypothetical protein [Roseburia sp. AM59-24XD]RHP87896.1 hypothetical protein DXA20_03675 [Roseburia sp. AM59-24XD]